MRKEVKQIYANYGIDVKKALRDSEKLESITVLIV